MYYESFEKLMSDEISEIIENIPETCAIVFNGFTYAIPNKIKNDGIHAVSAWRNDIAHGIKANMEVFDNDGFPCGLIPVWTLHNMLSGARFVVRSVAHNATETVIHNAHDLADYLQTTIESVPEVVNTYCDYKTVLTLSESGIILETTAGESGKMNVKQLVYPFSAETYDDAVSGLQCWADATYWENVNRGEA